MPFENEDKIPFKDLPVCDQVEAINTLAGKYGDREVWYSNTNTEGKWCCKGKPGSGIAIYMDNYYKVVKGDIVFTFGDDGTFCSNTTDIPAGKYKLVPIED